MRTPIKVQVFVFGKGIYPCDLCGTDVNTITAVHHSARVRELCVCDHCLNQLVSFHAKRLIGGVHE